MTQFPVEHYCLYALHNHANPDGKRISRRRVCRLIRRSSGVYVKNAVYIALAIMSKALLLLCLIPSLLYCAAASAADMPLTFKGRFEFRTDQESLEIIGKQVCFFPAPPSSKSVPRPAGDQRIPWFCFSNSALAAGRLGFTMNTHNKSCGIQGAATVVVVGYNRYTGEGEGNDVAKFKKS